MTDEKEFKVTAIKDGTVIDHVPSMQLFKVIEILGLENYTNQITFGMNLESKKLGNKAIIKIADRFFEDDDINRIALIAPQAKLNIIRNYKVVEKRSVTIPEIITGIAKCVNPHCITNHQPVETRFSAQSSGDGILLTCWYCEKTTSNQTLKIITRD
ncbi:MAG: aspartate carbamoyltransferase regulatory subunit [Prevotellaceae bacterium]|jgi:aspartate carbamoyltransferase regulatory subunit|nr:aspartate carbamoyltransferase regulatory subunit [Prevotellaceae bacterium]